MGIRKNHERTKGQSTPNDLTSQIYHGMQVSFDNAEYKLYQIYANAYVGILPHEWDDSIHIRNDTNLAHYELFQA
jgi:hypothetical protein